MKAEFQPISDNRLTIAGLERALTPRMNRSAIQRYDQNEELQKLLQKQGESYPASSLVWWEKIAEARMQKPPLVRPETAGLFLRGVMENPPIIEDRLTIIENSDNLPAVIERTGGEALALLADIRDSLQKNNPAPDDALLTAAQVRELVPHGPEWLRKNIPSVLVGNRRFWKRSAVREYIRGL